MIMMTKCKLKAIGVFRVVVKLIYGLLL